MTALLGGPLAERARIAVDAASALLVSVSADAITDPSYAVGAAGLAIAHANLHALFPARGHDRCTELLLERARTLAATARASPWLVQGIAGVGWATGYLTGDSGSSLDAFDAKLDRLAMPGRDGLPFLLTARAGATGRGAILGILGGVAGVALALATTLGEIDDAWDEPLLAGRAARDDQPWSLPPRRS